MCLKKSIESLFEPLNPNSCQLGKLEPLIDLLMLFGLHQQPTSAIQSILSHEKNRISIQIYT